MKTKLILHGGFDRGRKEEDSSDFYAEILKDLPEKAKVLIVPFAKDLDRIPDSTKKVMAEFNKAKSQEDLNFEIAKKESFIKQIKSADAVYIQGGVTEKLLETLKEFPDFKESIKGKVVAGESAGANIFGRTAYSPHADKLLEGLGVLPLKIIPHYSEKYKDIFKNVEPNLETLRLSEYEYKVFEF